MSVIDITHVFWFQNAITSAINAIFILTAVPKSRCQHFWTEGLWSIKQANMEDRYLFKFDNFLENTTTLCWSSINCLGIYPLSITYTIIIWVSQPNQHLLNYWSEMCQIKGKESLPCLCLVFLAQPRASRCSRCTLINDYTTTLL